MKSLFTVSLVFCLVGCNSSASWAYEFIKFNDTKYIVTEEKVESNILGQKLGEVKHFLDEDGDSSELSSNVYREGTDFFEIKGISSSEAIAVKFGQGESIKLVAEEE